MLYHLLKPTSSSVKQLKLLTSTTSTSIGFQHYRIRWTATATAMTTTRHFTQQNSPQEAEAAEAPSDTPFKSPKAEEIFHKMTKLQIEEIKLITELINQKLNITITENEKLRASGVLQEGTGGTSSNEEEAKEEVKTHFDIKLVGFDAKAKIKVIKEVRAMTGLGLKEAKELVEGAPKVVKKDIKLEEAEELKKKLEAIGATVELD